jgi:hypothetical protein
MKPIIDQLEAKKLKFGFQGLFFIITILTPYLLKRVYNFLKAGLFITMNHPFYSLNLVLFDLTDQSLVKDCSKMVNAKTKDREV